MRVTPLVCVSVLLFGGAPLSPGQDTEAKPDTAAKQDAAAKPDAAVSDLVARIEKAQASIQSLRVLLELVVTIPAVEGEKAMELRALMRVESLHEEQEGADPARYSRIDVDLDTPQGPLRTEKVRTPDGMWIHQASEFTGESWLKVDKETMRKLDRAADIFGSSGAMQSSGGGRPGAIIGADLLRGLSRQYDLALQADTEIDGRSCVSLRATLKKSMAAEVVDSLPSERPDEVHLYFARDDLLLRKMVQLSKGKVLTTLSLRNVELNPRLEKDRFVLVPPDGVRFKDIMSDQMASLRIKMDLKRLEEHDAAEKAREAGK